LEKAALRAAELGANTFQIFSASPRMWRSTQPSRLEIDGFRAARQRFDLAPLAVHANYLINLGSVDPVIRSKSIAAFRAELERSQAIGADYVVVHPGSCRGSSVVEGVRAVVEALAEAADGFDRNAPMLLLEHTAGAGCVLGSRFEELRGIHDAAARRTRIRIGYCLDTCHLLAAGFDIVSSRGLQATVERLEAVLDLENVKVIHANDSKMPLGSKIDRHTHIGEGHIGDRGFRRILTHPQLRNKPFILETPIDREGDDRRNIEKLKKLCPKSRTITARSS
jgi:deoxyribonuclease-4